MAAVIDFETIPGLFDRLMLKYATERRPMLLYKVERQYKEFSYADFRRSVELLANGLASLGVHRSDRVAIIAENRPEWIIADMAIACLGAVSVPIYPTLTPKQIEFIFNDAEVKIAIVSNVNQHAKVRKIKQEVKTLERTIVMNEKGEYHDRQALRFSEVTAKGKEFEKQNSSFLRDSIRQTKPHELLTIIYTSGTTGNPKGVMLTQKNLVSNINAAASVIPITESDTLLSFLPLCHSFERMAGYYTALACGASVAYAESADTVRDNLLEVHPTIVTTVPRLFERIYNRMMKQLDTSPPLRRRIFHWGVKVGREYVQARKTGSLTTSLAFQHSVATKLVFSKLQERMGGRMKFFVSGGAALSKELGEFFEAVGITIVEGYGLTETSPVLTCNRLDDYKFGTVGKPIPGVEIKIADDGEILAKGPNVMKGYYNDPKATAEVVDKEGWLHTGDIGMFDPQGHLMITDRKKHLFVSSGGKNIAPQPIESLFLQSKYIDQFVLIGDGRMFLTALIVPEFEILKDYAQTYNIRWKDDESLVASEEVRVLFDKEIQLLQKDLPTYERVRRFELLPQSLTIEKGEITPTLKVKRKVVEQRYAALIEKMYQNIT
ncbi:MAG: long-chain fatty acid--CoA ligase [bacterium]